MFQSQNDDIRINSKFNRFTEKQRIKTTRQQTTIEKSMTFRFTFRANAGYIFHSSHVTYVNHWRVGCFQYVHERPIAQINIPTIYHHCVCV